MNYKRLIVLVILFMMVVFFFHSCAKKEIVEITLPEGRTAEIIFLVGDVFITSKSGTWVKAEIGDILGEGVRIKTSENSYCEIVISSGTVFRMRDRSELQLVLLPMDERENKSLIELAKGDLLAKVQKIAYKSEDSIATSSVTLGVRGTEFLVHTEKDISSGHTEVLVAKGVVSVKMNVREPLAPEVPGELKSVLRHIRSGVKVRGGFKIEVSDQKVESITKSLEDIIQQKIVDEVRINKLKQEVLLTSKPLNEDDKKRLEELKDLSLSFKVGETVYISPNFDGINDDFVFSTEEFVNERLSGWKFIVMDSNSNIEKVIQNRISEEENHVQLPEEITWNLVGENGSIVRDGNYVYGFYTRDRNNLEHLRVKGRIIVDTEPPELIITSMDTTFSPNEDGVKDVVQIDIQAEKGIEWACVITTPEGIAVRNIEWVADIPDVFEWDGKGENGNILPEGVYNITFSGQDKAGNITSEIIKEITLDIRERSATVDIDHSIFSPNRDGKLDTVTFVPFLSDRRRIDTWDLIVQTEQGDTAKRFRGIGYIPEKIEWDGVPQRGKIFDDPTGGLPAGKYIYFLKVIYRSGVNTYSFKKELILDNDPPVVDVKISPGIFSPDGDGENDILFIRPEISDLTPILNWNAKIYTKNGSIFKSFSGIRMPCEELMWDGVSDAGRLVDSAEDYYLVFEATDSGLNTGISEKVLFSIDILVIPTERGLKIQVSNIEFRFDTADLQGEKTFAILRRGTEVLEKYSKYSIIIEGHTDSTGDEDYNLTLSQKRAESVGQFLIQNGIDAERLSYKGYGSQYPIDTNRTREGRARNRRVEFILIREK